MANSALSTTAAVAEGSVGESHLAAGATLKLGTEQATTSGTSIDFTGIPAGTKQIVVSFVGVSLSGTDNLLIQLGTSSGIETTGYSATGWSGAGGITHVTSTAGFIMRSAAATVVQHGQAILTLEDTSDNTWSAQMQVASPATSSSGGGAGTKALSGTLDRVRITRSGTDTFDAGSVNIAYK